MVNKDYYYNTVTRHVYSQVAIEYDKHDIRDINQISLNNKYQQIFIA